MATNSLKCKHRYKGGWFLFGKYRCAMALSGGKWAAKKAVCNTCNGPMWEMVHDCIYFQIGTNKPYSDKNAVNVKGYCFRIYKEEKDFRNEIKDLGACGIHDSYYRKRPISEQIKPDIHKAKTVVAKPLPFIPKKLKIWTLLPALLLMAVGIIGLLLKISHWDFIEKNWDVIDQQVSWLMISIGFLVGILPLGFLRGKKLAYNAFKILIIVADLSWILYFYKLAAMRHFTWSFNFYEVITIIYLTLAFIATTITLFRKLPEIEALLYPGETKADINRVIRATGQFFVDIFRAFPPLIRFFIILFIVLVAIPMIIGVISKPGTQPPKAPPPILTPKPTTFPSAVPKISAPPPVPKIPKIKPIQIPTPILPPTLPTAPRTPSPLSVVPTVHEIPRNNPTISTQETIRRYIELGKDLHENGKYSKAIEIFNRVLEIERNNEEALKGKKDAEEARELTGLTGLE